MCSGALYGYVSGGFPVMLNVGFGLVDHGHFELECKVFCYKFVMEFNFWSDDTWF